MSKIIYTLLLTLCLVTSLVAQETAQSIIQKVDNNQVFNTQYFEAEMTIQKGKRELTKKFYGYGKKEGQKSFMEFTNPEDKGVKYLKLDNELWIYFPDADDIMKISGHMLRQGMMGSDISYEDMLENESLDKKYKYELLADEKVEDQECYVVQLLAKQPTVTYAKQIIRVDKKKFIPLEIEMYAKGGRLIKKIIQTKLEKNGSRWNAKKMEIKDMRKKNSSTIVEFEKIKFDDTVPSKVFTKAYLRR